MKFSVYLCERSAFTYRNYTNLCQISKRDPDFHKQVSGDTFYTSFHKLYAYINLLKYI